MMAEGAGDQLDRWLRPWRLWLLFFWLAVALWMINDRWGAIRIFALSDTDDNMRMMQVRALLEGQGWYDLRQHRLSPPVGADIHWSRLVDLPIAGLKLLLSPLLGGRLAEQSAAAVAPLLPMLVAMGALVVTARRLIDPRAFPIAIALIACAGSARGMWAPMRIDHHGWQLAMLALVVAASADPRRARGGALVGAATAVSLTIGLELLPYLALAGAAVAVRWILDPQQSRRLAAYGVTLAGGCCLGFLLFASEANRAPVCDALSPVWLSIMVLAGTIAFLLARLPERRWPVRLAAAGLGGAGLLLTFALVWPDCLGRPEGFSQELERLWLSKVREAMPVYRHGARTAVTILTLPVAGLIGYALMLWRERRRPERLIPWAVVASLAAAAAALLFWQTRAAPAAQLLSIPGATALVWLAILFFARQKLMLVRVFGIFAAFLVASGLATGYFNHFFPAPTPESRRPVNLANNRCPTMAALRPIALQPKGIVLTFVDLGPRLITVTHHDAIIGPYHRNARQIIDVMRAWRGDSANARRTARRYDVDYVLICPNLSESTVYRAEAPAGFYVQLVRGQVPDWLERVPLPSGSPYRMWRVEKAPGQGAEQPARSAQQGGAAGT